MKEAFQNMKVEKINKYKLYAGFSIVCPIIAFLVSYLERTIHYARLAKSNISELSIIDVLIVGHERTLDELSELLFWFMWASVTGFLLALISVSLKQKLTVVGFLSFTINGFPIVFVLYLCFYAVLSTIIR